VSLIDYLEGLRPQRNFVTAPVVSTEKKIRSAGENDTHIGLSIASITAVCRRKCWSGKRRSHQRPLS